MRRLAVVVQRYGREVLGGAEEHCRQIVGRLAGRFEQEVFTTCARDYLTWQDAYPPGRDMVEGIPVHRFPVVRQRRVRAFGRFSQRIFDRPHRFRDEAEWMDRQGPDCPGLIAALAERRTDFDLFFFFTYLYTTTFHGLPQVADRSVLLPTSHDEPPIRLSIFRALFHLPRGIIYNTAEERAFIQGMFHNEHVPSVVGGMGFELPAPAAAPPVTDPYLLYLGRVDVFKGCGELIDHWQRFRAAQPGAPRLLLAGEVKMRLPRDSGLVALGFVTEQRKAELLAGALALVVPSRYESLSMVTLEAWAAGVPVLAQGATAVLAGHLERSGGGWDYRDADGFARVLTEALSSPEERRRRGAAGRSYVAEHYSWERTIAVYGEFLDRIGELCERTR